MNRFLLGIAVLLLAATGCKKADDLTAPEVQTLSVTALSPNVMEFKGNVVSKGRHKVLDYGFVYSGNGVADENNGTKVSLGTDIREGNFAKTVTNIRFNVGYPNMVYARAYVRDERGTAFGALISAALPSPAAGDIVPAMGKSGDLVKISGKFYSPELDEVKVAFQNTMAKVVSVNDTEIKVEVPAGINARHGGQIAVTVSIGNIPVVATNYFTILANVKDFSPKSGTIGTVITFSGDNLLPEFSNGSAFTVYFGDKPAPIIYSYLMQAQVPSGQSGKVPVSIAYNGQKINLPGEFEILAASITAVTPEPVMPLMQLRITGANLPNQQNPYENNPMARLGDAPYTSVSYDYQSTYSFIVPENTAEGSYTLTLKLGNTEIVAPAKVTVKGYEVTGFAPKSAAPGAQVDIKGAFIKDNGYTVYFGTTSAWAQATSATNLRVTVPGGVNAGKVKLSVDLPGGRISAPGEFEMVGPDITSFSPTSGVAGTIITIKGSGFFPGDWSTTVKFGTISVQAIKTTENTITVAVPSNLNPGAMKLSVVTGGQEVMADGNFTATN
ncbi:IPT/TIG domain-containing protein [Pedobacter sp. JY14-1]|uniref:IPT/TIG domain-containing protein n=1 Tax=Pedobacter sp. JY14-1 TaxID=3034151 RepID=UPI0023E2D10C|nr:IPT/TIG domain-containing protein [Pedobacter sp. JY14-1]